MQLKRIIFAVLAFAATSGCGKLPVQPDEPVESECWAVDLGELDFSESFVFKAVADGRELALITREYLGDALGKQAVLVYLKDAEGGWRTDSIAVPVVTLVQKGLTFVAPDEAVSGGTLKYYDTEDKYYYNDISKACELPQERFFIKMSPDGSTFLKLKSNSKETASLQPVKLELDGYGYPIVKIAGSLWTAENLKATHYADGSAIASSSGWTSYVSNWKQSPNPAGGLLYNAMAIGFSGTSAEPSVIVSKLAPSGWSVPKGGSFGEWAALAAFVPGAAYLLSSSHNVTGFSVIPSGRVNVNGEVWAPEDDDCLFWSSSNDTEQKAFFAKIYSKTEGDLIRYTSSTNKRAGFSLRLVKPFE